MLPLLPEKLIHLELKIEGNDWQLSSSPRSFMLRGSNVSRFTLNIVYLFFSYTRQTQVHARGHLSKRADVTSLEPLDIVDIQTRCEAVEMREYI